MTFFKKTIKGFTLLETLASIAVLSLVIIGPLSVTISSSGYARLTKDTIVATYLAEEAVELLQNQYDSLYIYCKKNASSTELGGYCYPRTDEMTTGQTAWRLFKTKLSSVKIDPADPTQTSCFLPNDGQPVYTSVDHGNANGCAFDVKSFQDATITQPLPRYDASIASCKYLVPVSTSTSILVASTTGGGVYKDGRENLGAGVDSQTGYIMYTTVTATSTSYVCSGVPAHIVAGGLVQPKQYARTVTIEQLSTFETGDADTEYSDDLRITSNVSFKALNGVSHNVKITRFMHARP
jgi:prepilin-type N-terminal cleavage/methylation domain-containing protein